MSNKNYIPELSFLKERIENALNEAGRMLQSITDSNDPLYRNENIGKSRIPTVIHFLSCALSQLKLDNNDKNEQEELS